MTVIDQICLFVPTIHSHTQVDDDVVHILDQLGRTSDFRNHADSQQVCYLRLSMCLLMLLTSICSRGLQQMHVSDTGLWLAASGIIFFTFLKTEETFGCRHSSGTSPRA